MDRKDVLKAIGSVAVVGALGALGKAGECADVKADPKGVPLRPASERLKDALYMVSHRKDWSCVPVGAKSELFLWACVQNLPPRLPHEYYAMSVVVGEHETDHDINARVEKFYGHVLAMLTEGL
jgi:hypothetical protein